MCYTGKREVFIIMKTITFAFNDKKSNRPKALEQKQGLDFVCSYKLMRKRLLS